MPTDVQTAWDNYVQAQRAYMAAVKEARRADGQAVRGEGQGAAAQNRILNSQRSTINTQHSAASTQRSTLNPAAKAGTLIAFDDAVVDFGTVDQGTESTSAFLYRNKGTQMLRIGDVTSSCGCAVAQPEPRDVPPGGVGILKLSFKSGSFSGPIHKTITVRSNDPVAPTITLGVKATVRTLFVVEPKVVNFGEIDRGKQARQEVTLKPATQEAFTLQQITTTHPELKAQLVSGHQEAQKAQRGQEPIKLLFTVDANRNYGPFTFAARVYMARPAVGAGKAAAKPLEFTIPVTGTVAGSVRVKPDSLFLGSIPQGQTFRPQKVMLSSRNGKPVEIRSVDTGYQGLKAEVKPLKPGFEYEVALTNVAPLPMGFIQRTMQIVTSESAVPIEVKLSGVVMKPATRAM
jgi:hypothetical protein